MGLEDVACNVQAEGMVLNVPRVGISGGPRGNNAESIKPRVLKTDIGNVLVFHVDAIPKPLAVKIMVESIFMVWVFRVASKTAG